MDTGSACIDQEATLRQAAHRMRKLGVPALPVCGTDGLSCGIISSDMIVRQIAAGGDPRTVTVGELTPGMPGAAGPGGAGAGLLSWGGGSPAGTLRALERRLRPAA